MFIALVFCFFLEKNEHVATDIYSNDSILNQDQNKIASLNLYRGI